MITSAAALAAALMVATAAPPQAISVAAPRTALTAETVLDWQQDLAKASHVMCRRTLAPTERSWETRRACVRETLDEAVAATGAPALAAVHAALPKPERYTPILSGRREALLTRAQAALARSYAEAR